MPVSVTIAYLGGVCLDLQDTVDLNAVENAEHSLGDAWVDQEDYYDEGCQDLPLDVHKAPPKRAIPYPHCENDAQGDWGQDRKDYQV